MNIILQITPPIFPDKHKMFNLNMIKDSFQNVLHHCFLSVCVSTGLTAEFNTKLTVKLRYLGCRVLTALPTPHPPPPSEQWMSGQ